MPKPQVPTFGIGLLALMASGPFLFPYHTQPIPSFWSEWWAGALGLAAAAAILARPGRGLPLPALLGIPAVLLLTLLLQFAFGRITFPQLGLLHAAYLLWAGLLLVLGRHLADTIGLARFADVLATAIALGALAGAAIALAQWLGLAQGMPWLFPRLGSGIYGNIGQANHHVHFSWLGVASLLYLRARSHLPRPLLWLALLPLAFGSVLAGSRSVFLYPVILLALTAWAWRREPDGTAARIRIDAALLLPVVVALNLVGAALAPDGATAGSPAARLYESVSGANIRLAVARTAWVAFIEHPWLGQGAGNYAWASFVAAGMNDGPPMQVAENSHNLILHGLAEFGAPATSAVILLLLVWARHFFARAWQPEHLWVAAVLGIGAAHALLEYPYWYAYFLGPTALLLGVSDSGRSMTLGGRRALFYLAAAAIGGGAILAGLRADFATIEAATYRPLAAHAERESAWRISMERLQALHRESLLAPWAMLAFASLARPERDGALERATLCERGIRFSPARELVSRCAVQLAIAGRAQDARVLARAVLLAYPGERERTLAELNEAARDFPEAAPLLPGAGQIAEKP